MMFPSSPQLPPMALSGASPTATAEPPRVATFLTLPPVKKPIHSPSGEKNGIERLAAWVPAIGVATA